MSWEELSAPAKKAASGQAPVRMVAYGPGGGRVRLGVLLSVDVMAQLLPEAAKGEGGKPRFVVALGTGEHAHQLRVQPNEHGAFAASHIGLSRGGPGVYRLVLPIFDWLPDEAVPAIACRHEVTRDKALIVDLPGYVIKARDQARRDRARLELEKAARR
ncbi:hypothetical protein L0F51_04075 [Afifella sp. H1R]|uniref:hypothetical protein n=1 Tax=Afifella sp. H1R TaxID=2908841 RepID=UPI001F24A905|nr:hypothetical protein [Afifella sp. H1R]MCF1502942.1 hypothetical protein [Afifella sp. H1R]